MNAQELYDRTVNHLFAQGQRSDMLVDPMHPLLKVCMYRMPDGRKSAIGFMIDDELYEPDMERRHQSFLLDLYWDKMPAYLVDHFTAIPQKQDEPDPERPRPPKPDLPPLAILLEEAHDNPKNWLDNYTMIGELCMVARTHGLSTDVLENAEFGAPLPNFTITYGE